MLETRERVRLLAIETTAGEFYLAGLAPDNQTLPDLIETARRYAVLTKRACYLWLDAYFPPGKGGFKLDLDGACREIDRLPEGKKYTHVPLYSWSKDGLPSV